MKCHRFFSTILTCSGLFALSLLPACSFFSNENDKNKSDQNNHISIAILPTADCFPLFLAHKRDQFKQAGLDVKLTLFQSAMERDSAFQGKQSEGMCADLISPALMRQAGTDLRVTSLTIGENAGDGRVAILASPSSPVHSVEDFKKYPVAISAHTVVDFITQTILQDQGLKADEIQTTIVSKLPLRVSMLIEDKIPAATMADPWGAYAELHGARVIVDDKKHNVSQATLIFHKDSIDQKTAALQKMQQILNATASEINKDPIAFRAEMVEFMRLPAEVKDLYQPAPLPVNKIPTEEQTMRVIAWLKNRGLLQKDYAYHDLVTDVCLEKTTS